MVPDQKRTIAAVIAAGGLGSRFKSTGKEAVKPKQFLQLGGRPLYQWSLIALAGHKLVDIVVLSTTPSELEEMEKQCSALKNQADLRADIKVVAGGETRQESVFNALTYLEHSGSPDFVLIHDAARPFIKEECINDVIEQVIKGGACTVGNAVSDTIKRVKDGLIVETLPREELVAVQTPQAAKFLNLLNAHKKAAKESFAATDDTALLEWCGQEVSLIEGQPYNMKITQPLDMILAEALANYIYSDRL